MGLTLKLFELFHIEDFFLEDVPQVLILLHQIEAPFRPLAPFFDLFSLGGKVLNLCGGLLDLRLFLGQSAREALFLGKA